MQNFSTFNTYILRTATFPVSFYTNLLKKYSTSLLFETVEMASVKNAIKLASPELIQEVEKHNQNPNIYSKEKASNLELSLLKYIARMSSRATPFGLFAACSTGNIAEKTNVILQEKQNAHTQFDMQFWMALLQKFSKNEGLQKQLLYKPNTTLYSVGDYYRYVEYYYLDQRRTYCISSFRKNYFLEIIVDKAKKGLKIEELSNLIIDSESEREEASEFIKELIENQILVSNLEATITGSNETARVLEILKSCKGITKEYNAVKEIITFINSLNQPLDFNTSNLHFIHKKIKELNVDFEEKYLLQTDLYNQTIENSLNKNITDKLSRAISFLGNIQDAYSSQNLENFKNAFQKRYESKEMPLAIVLDTETGIGYLQNSGMNDSNPILDKFNIYKNNSSETKEYWTENDYYLEKKIQNCIINKESFITLKEQDFKNVPSKNRNLPATFSALIEIVADGDGEKIVLDSLGNFSAAKLIGRFCNGSQEINKLAKEIVEKETVFCKESVLAEIAHIPESRTGNILRRPVLRTYEIPYLANSSLPKAQQIELDDLMVCVKNNTVFLRSKKLNKEIIPCLSNAHNYSSNALPIYQFLSDLQGQKVNPVHKFDWGVLKNHYTYFPRMMYQDVILSKAKWLIIENDFKTNLTFHEFEEWRSEKQIPKYVNMVDGDNTLLLDLEIEVCFKLLIKTLKSKKKITLEEFLFVENSIVKNENEDHFVNQFIISFYAN
ncbi:lantibiotic dehydratase family protein [Flavobacterium sp.]|uniref:lantibiotic dehydratase family protein n=1 Tax=Flavobacterium sp. TaxID=239 RepID=UPI003F6A368F